MVAASERRGVALSFQLVRPELGNCVDPCISLEHSVRVVAGPATVNAAQAWA